jgi:RHS repeat-associated protein
MEQCMGEYFKTPDSIVVFPNTNGTHDYAYDTLYQIIQATHPTPPDPLEQFSYDVAGNRLDDLTHNDYNYNELNQLTEDDSCLYTYDADGNMTTKISKQTHDTTTFMWDIENKLVEVRKPGMIVRHTYDALGRRMSKTVNGETKKFGYDGNDLILEMNGQDSILANYTHGPGVDDPLMMNRAGKNYYYTKDGLGSVTALTDSTGSVVHEYKYSVFGKIVEETGDSVENPFTYTSREMDGETGLMYYRARYYCPQTGRFLSEDPIGFTSRDMNFYRYCFNSPIKFLDPLGLFEIYGYAEGDLVGITGGEASIAISGDWSHPSQSGIFIAGAGATGANVGVGIGAGFTVRDIEGKSFNVDFNLKVISLTISFDEKGFNGLGLSVGPGVGISSSYAVTKPLWQPFKINDPNERSVLEALKSLIMPSDKNDPCSK